MAPPDEINPRKKPKQERSAETVKAILQAASQVLERFRLNKSSTDKIAERAGVSIGTLYQYFPNKESLVSFLFDKELDKNIEALQNLFEKMRSQDIDAFIIEFVEEVHRVFIKKRLLLRALYEHVFRFAKIETVITARMKAIEVLAQELEYRQKEIDVTDYAQASFVIVNMIMGLVEAVIFVDPLPFPEENLRCEMKKFLKGYLLPRHTV